MLYEVITLCVHEYCDRSRCFFIPTGVIVDADTNTSFVIHIIDPVEKFLDTGNVEDLVIRLYLMAKG